MAPRLWLFPHPCTLLASSALVLTLHLTFFPSACCNLILTHSTHAQIITRGTRSLGYGFVTFSTDAEAQTAIQLLNKRDVGGREISVESAKPQTAADAEKPKSRRSRSKKAKDSTRAPRRARTDEGEEGAAEEEGAVVGHSNL